MGAKCEIAFSIVGMLIGISVFFCFGIVFSNWDCAAWGLVSGVLAAITLYLHICFLRDRCKSTATQLGGLMLTGCVFQLAGVCGFVAYLVLAISEHQGLVIRGRGFYLACVWCFMTWKWAFLQFYFARRYKRCFEKETGTSSDVPYVKI